MQRYAWTGGDVPTKETKRNNTVYRTLRTMFFRELVRICGGLDLWDFKDQYGDRCYPGTSALERARIFWNQASLDAWRTYERNGLKEPDFHLNRR